MSDREQLIASLAANPGRRRFRPLSLALLWGVASLIHVAALTWLLGPVRDGVPGALFEAPRLGIEALVAVLLVAGAAWLAFTQAVPGGPRPAVRVWVLLAGLGWLALFAWAAVDAPIAASMAHKRPYCAFEIALLASPPAAVGGWLLARGYVLNPRLAGFAIGLAAGALAALAMQLACLYSAAHGLLFHLLPGLAVAGVAALVGSRAAA